MLAKKLSMSLIIVVVALFVGQSALADRTYTTSEDFAEGEPVNVNSETPDKNQLQLDTPTINPFVYVAASGLGTVVRIDADDGTILGEYLTAPEETDGIWGLGPNPSRMDVDNQGNAWVANRDVAGDLGGSVVKIGLVLGGTELIDLDTGNVFLAPPFRYNTCVDRDEDGLIMTSTGNGHVLSWQNDTDGDGGDDGIVRDAEDECILLYQRLPLAPNAHHVSMDADDNVWVGGYTGGSSFDNWGLPNWFYKLNGQNAAVALDDSGEKISFNAADIGCGGFGGLVDDKGILWSASPTEDLLLRYDPASPEEVKGTCIPVSDSYGLAVDSIGFIWNSMWFENAIAKINPDVLSDVSSFWTDENVFAADTGVAVTPKDNNVWVAKSFDFEVVRLNNDGTEQSSIYVGSNPTGIAVDFYGYVWVTNLYDNNVVRIDPDKNEVDVTVKLDAGSSPDNYSNMTGAVAPLGTWTVIHDGEIPGNSWGTISWNSNEPTGTGLKVEARAADTEDDLAKLDVLEDQGYVEVSNGVAFDLTGQFIQVRVTFQPDDTEEGAAPVLFELMVKSVEPEPEGLVCDVNEDEIIDIFDIMGIFFTIGDDAAQPFDPRDWDEDKTITIIDARGCVLECANQYCAPE